MFTILYGYADLGLFLVRLIVGIIFIYHGLPKLRRARAFAAGMGMSAPAVFLVGLVETLSAVALIVGFQVQPAALALAFIMVGATYKKIFTWGIPFSAPDKMGWEFDVVLLASALALATTGGGSIRLFF